jgi:NADP-dependent aldehyde dehydrogenase
LQASVTLGAGQFCTNPGLVFLPDDGSEVLIKSLGELMGQTPPFTMLTSRICDAYLEGVSSLARNSHVTLIAKPEAQDKEAAAGAALFATDAASFLKDGGLSAEVFGPSTLLVKYSSREQLVDIARRLKDN